MQSREFHNSKEIHRRIATAAASNSFSKDNEKSQPQPQKKGRSSIIDSGDKNWIMYLMGAVTDVSADISVDTSVDTRSSIINNYSMRLSMIS